MLRSRHRLALVVLSCVIAATACDERESAERGAQDTAAPGVPMGTAPMLDSVPPDAAWLAGGEGDERFVAVARHLRGLDVAMMEIGHRYAELHWAGQDRNWPYAEYQATKIRTALRNAVERRPARATSAAMLDAPLDSVLAAVERQDAGAFAERFETLTATCNSCHAAERVAFMRVVPPTARQSVIRAPSASAGAAGAAP